MHQIESTKLRKFFLFNLLLLLVISFGCTKNSNETQTEELVENEPQVEGEFEGNQEDRQDWFIRQRMYPFDKIPDEARKNAWEKRPPDSKDNLTGPQQWQSIGPSPTDSAFPNNWGETSGRINAVAVSPTDAQNVLVGGATGGIWRSTNGGTSFTSVSDNQVDLAVGSIAFAPSNSTIVYAGMGDKSGGYLGSGVLKSTDSGQTWVRVSNATLPAPGRVSKILVHPTNPNLVLVAQYARLSGNTLFSSGFFYSNDGGVNWTRTLQGLPRDMVQHPTQPNTFYLAMGRVDGGGLSTGGVFKSTDSGVNWTRVYTSPFTSTSNIKIAVTPAAPSNLYVLVGGTPRIEKSVNEGSTWTNLGQGSGFDGGQFSYNCYLFVHPTDPDVFYVGTRDLWRTLDGGTTYTNVTRNFPLSGGYTPTSSKAHPDQHHFYQSTSNPNTFYIANDGGIWRTDDDAQTFASLNNSLSLTMFTSVDLHPTDETISYGGTQDNGTQRRTGANSWKEFSSGDGGQSVIDGLDPSIVYTTYIRHSIRRWNQNGTSFGGTIGNSSKFNSDRVAFYPPFVGNGVDSTLYFGTYRLYVSTDRGITWNPPGGTTDLTNGNTLSAIGVSKSDTNTIYTGSSGGRLMVSTNGGTNWTDRTTGLPNRFISSIIVNPTSPNTAYVVFSGYNSGHVYKTTNAGQNWTDISGNLPDTPTNTLLIDPNNETTIYVGTDIGVFRSTTDGNTWETFNNGMPPTIVSELDAQANGRIQAATYGRGAYQIAPATNSLKTKFDFDGDSKTDVSIFRPGTSPSQWWYLKSSDLSNSAFSFGTSTDTLVPADFTGDGKTDIAFWRESTGEWFVLRSEDNSFYSVPFGTSGDIPAPGDFDNDGKADTAVFRPSTSTWFIQNSGGGTSIIPFGVSGDKPVVADYDGDGKDDIAIYRPSVNQWWLNRSADGVVAYTFGAVGDKTVQGDYTGDGKADVAIFRPSSGEWFVLRSEDLSFFAFPFGISTDIPTPGDYDGDGKFDSAVFRPSTNTWFISGSTAGGSQLAFGTTGDVPLPNAYSVE